MLTLSCSGLARALSVFLAAILLSSVSFGQQEELYQLYTKAQQAQQAQDYSAAAGYYEQIVRLQPDLAEAFANLGSIYYQMGDETKASQSLKKAIELKPELSAPYFFLGVLAARARKYEEAVRYLKTAEKADSSNLVAQLYLGFCYYGLGDYPAAAASFERASALEEYRADAYYHLSKAYSNLSKDAFALLQSKYGGSFFSQLVQAHFYEAKGSWKEAKEAYAGAVEKRPGDAGLAERLRWTSAKAAEEGTQAPPPALPETVTGGSLRLFYNPPSGSEISERLREYQNIVRSVASQSANEEEKLFLQAENYQALSYLASLWIAENEPNSYRAHQLRGQMHEARGKNDEAVAEYRRALELKPDLQNVHFAIGSLYWASGRLEEALPELQQELRINSNHPEAHYEIADILYNRQDLPEAKKHLLECLKLDPNMPEAHLAIERIYSAEGQFDKALEHMRAASRIAPQDPTPHYRMSIIYRKLGKEELVREELRRFQELRAQQAR